MSDFKTGRKPPHPPGHELRLPIPWLHELDGDVAEGSNLAQTIAYPLDLTNGITEFPMWGNGPDPTLTITDAEGPHQPVGDCHKAGEANAAFIDGNPGGLTSNIVVNNYDLYEAESQDVPLGQEQDDGVVMSDALVWELTHDWNGNAVPLGSGIVTAFVPVHPATVAAVMAKYRKPILTGVNLTSQDQQTFPVWSESPANPPNQQDGHVVLLALLRSAPSAPTLTFGPAGPISWTKIVDANEAWMNACPEEFWMRVGPEDRSKMGAAAYDALVAQMATLPGFQGTPPEAPPAPAPPAPAPAPPPAPPKPPAPPQPPAPPTVTPSILSRALGAIKAAFAMAEAELDKLINEENSTTAADQGEGDTAV